LDVASSSIAFLSAAFGTRMEPRSFPFTCTTSSTSSCSSAAASGCGHGATMTSSPKPHCCHRWWLMCGVMGESTRRRMDSPSFAVALDTPAFSIAFSTFMQAEATVLNWWRSMS
jgi:hypothetical protein